MMFKTEKFDFPIIFEKAAPAPSYTLCSAEMTMSFLYPFAVNLQLNEYETAREVNYLLGSKSSN